MSLARAKINLMLHVTGRRNDGYHLLQSLVMFAETGDRLTVQPSNDLTLDIRGAFADSLQKTSGDNLVLKAAYALAKHAGRTPQARITLQKNLPIGAGLGGGSADAATALHLLAEYWQLELAPGTLHRIANTLGSDVPACLSTTPQWMEGTGHILTPLDVAQDIPALLVNPGKEVPTKDVYHALTPPYDAEIPMPQVFQTVSSLLDFLKTSHNALETPAIALEPAIGGALHELQSLPGCELARMSGSGATCFGLFPTPQLCEDAARMLQARHPDWWIVPTTLRGTHG